MIEIPRYLLFLTRPFSAPGSEPFLCLYLKSSKHGCAYSFTLCPGRHIHLCTLLDEREDALVSQAGIPTSDENDAACEVWEIVWCESWG